MFQFLNGPLRSLTSTPTLSPRFAQKSVDWFTPFETPPTSDVSGVKSTNKEVIESQKWLPFHYYYHCFNQQNVSPYRKSRKCLSSSWSAGGDANIPGLTAPTSPVRAVQDIDSFNLLETPVLSLVLFYLELN